MSRPFHVAFVPPRGYPHAGALAEAVEYLAHVLAACGHPTSVGDDVRPGAHNVIVGAHLLDAARAATLPPDAIVLNTEPLADLREHAAYRDLLGRHRVWDYAHANLSQLPHDRATVIPFWYRAELARAHLPRSDGERLVFYGVLTPHRRALLAALFTRGVDVDVRVGCYGEERDRWMRGALGVLNLRKHAGARTFEPLRCFHALINEVPVITEDTPDPSADPFRDACTFVPTAELADAIAARVRDRAAFRTQGRAAARRFHARDPIPQIAEAVAAHLAS